MSKIIDSLRSNGEVDQYLKEAIRQHGLEFEWIYGSLKETSKLTKEVFVELKRALNSSTYSIAGESNTLDIRCEMVNKGRSVMSNIRASLEGVQQIKQYCLQDNFDDLEPTYIRKSLYKDPKNKTLKYNSILSGLYPCRVNLKHEEPLNGNNPEIQLLLNHWKSKKKYFRYKKRYSYVSANSMWRIDLTGLKSSDKNTYATSFRESGILQKDETFELEIEYIGSTSHTFAPPPITDYINKLKSGPFSNIDDDVVGNEPSLGNVFIGDLSFANDEENQDLYIDSPRYDEGIEFDEPYEPVVVEPPLPDSVRIHSEFWTDNKQEDVYKLIEKGYEAEEWIHKEYKFIPRSKQYSIYKGNSENKLLVDINPPLQLNDDTIINNLLVPVKYIIDYSESWSADKELSSDKELSADKGSMSVDTATVTSILNELETMIHFCMSVIDGTEYFMDSEEVKDVLKEYMDLTDPSNIHHKKGWQFMGPQPVSMGIQHLHPLNSHSIMSKYVVTEKADGIRALLMIHGSRGYLITPKKEVIDTGFIMEGVVDGWIFDGEYITTNKDGEPIKLFMIFDVYYSSEYKDQPYTYPWLAKKGTSRSSIIHKFKQDVDMKVDDTYPSSKIRIGYKQYLEGPEKLKKKKGSDEYTNIMGIFKSTKKIIGLEDSASYEYSTDGLIFLPMFLPVKGTNEDDKVKSIKGTWIHNYKWKPPEENTIDFKVIYIKDKGKLAIHSYIHDNEDGSKEVRYYQKVQLVVGYDEKQDDMIDFNWSILTNQPYNKQSYECFNPPKHKKNNIHITNIPLTNKKMKCPRDGKDIKNGSIVEMRYDGLTDNGFTWIPLRVRDDKVKPQFFTIANNIWQTINEPVTKEMITGSINFDDLKLVNSDKYYVDSKLCEDTPIRDLHNYIKSKLISRVCSSPDFKEDLMIVDLSCGRGGDIKKYISSKNKIEFILGLDISGNINEASQRYHYLPKPKPKSLFLQYDTSQSIEKKEGCLGSTASKEICSDMLDMISGKSKSFHKKYKDVQKSYAGLATKGFDVVSSQFSLHYYFKDEESLRGFCENVKYLCADGGYFIGTCYDGMKLMKTFAKEDTDVLEMKDDFGSLIYQIKKKYKITDFSYDKDNIDDMFGQEIEVFMASIGQSITEYLVNFEFFIDLMKEYGFELALPTYKKGEYNPIKDPIQSFDKIIENTSELRENDKGFIQKTNNTELYKVHSHKEYKLLSGLNNWFVFTKT